MSKVIIYFCLFSVLAIQMMALYKGINGKVLAISIGIFGAILGYWIHILKSKHNKGGEV